MAVACAAALVALLALPAAALAKRAHFQSYGGYGTTASVVVRGRAVKGAPPSGTVGRSRAKKIASTARAFLRRDLEEVEVLVTDVATGAVHRGRTDDEGFYDVRVPGPFPAGERRFALALGRHKYVADPLEVKVRVVDAEALGVVVVCDIDDTIVDTGVTAGIWEVVEQAATSDAGDIPVFPGAAATLTAFADAGAPVVYLSASPVDIAPRLMQMLAMRGFPPGTLFLRHYGTHGIGDPTDYKLARFARVLEDFPARKLVLLGDNGEKDPELFARLADQTGRVAGAFVRATLAADAKDPRYRGMTVFSTWGEVARHAGRARLVRWMTAQRIALRN